MALAMFGIGAAAYAGGLSPPSLKDVKQHVERRSHDIREHVKQVTQDPLDYKRQLPGTVLADACAEPVHRYGDSMEAQVGRWKRLPARLIREIQRDFGNDLSKVRYAENIDTGGDQAVTMGNHIYFPRRIDLYDADDMWWLMHELEHTVQYRGESRSGKLCEYVAKSIGSGLNHDRIDWERAANRKANWIVDDALWAINQM
ncbi:MAG: DUF4157 domain-containing protein [Steroidobacter sp.]|nr:DUF4157 domain-containing protein [Steroidobacter sp.]